MNLREEIIVSRNCEAIMIPSGERVLVPEGARATIKQSLGGAATLIPNRGRMDRRHHRPENQTHRKDAGERPASRGSGAEDEGRARNARLGPAQDLLRPR